MLDEDLDGNAGPSENQGTIHNLRVAGNDLLTFHKGGSVCFTQNALVLSPIPNGGEWPQNKCWAARGRIIPMAAPDNTRRIRRISLRAWAFQHPTRDCPAPSATSTPSPPSPRPYSARTVTRSAGSPVPDATSSSPAASGPTPSGVPVYRRSPGSSVNTDDTNATTRATDEIM